jgi:hypothetical protein
MGLTLPQEVWDEVTQHLPSLSTRHAARILGFGLWPSQERHSGVWDEIIEENSWITKAIDDFKVKPVLIGQNLHNCVDGSNKPAYLALVMLDNSGDLRFQKDAFLESLKGRPKLNNKNEVYFPSSNITLNVSDIVGSPEVIRADTKRLFSYRYRKLKSAYLLWDDPQYRIRTIQTEDIVGIGGKARTLKSVKMICGLTITFSDNHREQYVFKTPTSEKGGLNIRLMGKGLNGECTGWVKVRY